MDMCLYKKDLFILQFTLSKYQKKIAITQLTFACSKSTIERLEKGVDFEQVNVCWVENGLCDTKSDQPIERTLASQDH